MRTRARAGALALGLIAAGLLAAAVSRAEPVAGGPDDPRLLAMARMVLANPQDVRRYVALARTQPEKAGAPILLLAGQYELGRGRFAAADRYFTSAIAVGGEGPWRPVAENGLGWAALGRGDFAGAHRHYVASGLSDPDTTVVTALIDAAGGDAQAVDILTPFAAGDAPPDLVDVARLALAYAELWTGKADAAEAAFGAVTSAPLLDDATYAMALLRARRGDLDGARAGFTALAELPPPANATRPGRALLELTPSAVMRAGLRRTRGTPITSQREQLLTVLDGDGIVLARAALRGATARGEHRAEGSRSAPIARAPAVAESRPALARVGHERPAATPTAAHQPFAVATWALLLLVGMAAWWIMRRLSS